MKKLKFLLGLISRFNERVGSYFACWLIFPLILVITYDVIFRYFFNKTSIWGYDMAWMLYAAFVFLGGAYTHVHEGHVKVDIIYNLFSARVRALIDVICHLVFFFPAFIALTLTSYNLAYKAWIFSERSPYTNWQPHTGPIKTILVISILLMLFQGIVVFSTQLITLVKGEDHES